MDHSADGRNLVPGATADADISAIGEPGLAALVAHALAPMFDRPTRLNVDSAWYGHLPFAHWVVTASAPRVLVELGAHAGVSYSAFCEAVLRARLETRCFAVDTWEGDEHAGFYDESVYADLKVFHDARYAGFSQMLRCTFDDALAHFPDRSIDLLHIDGRHRYDDVRHDFDTWRAKLSPRAVVLFHDTNVRERDFGVWRLWSELREQAPGFEFYHGHGLGILAFGSDAPGAVRALCTLEAPRAASLLRERFALLGERWIREFDAFAQQREAKAAAQNAARTAAVADEQQKHVEVMHRQLVDLIPRADRASGLRVELSAARQDRWQAEQQRLLAEQRLAQMQAAHTAEISTIEAVHTDQLNEVRTAEARATARMHTAFSWAQGERERAEAAERRNAALVQAGEHRDAMHAADLLRLRNTLSWRITRPLRVVRRLMSRLGLPLPAPAPSPAPSPAPLPALSIELTQPAAPQLDLPHPVAPAVEPVHLVELAQVPSAPPSAPRLRKILFASGESHTPGSVYRSQRLAALARSLGWDSEWLPIGAIGVPPLIGVDLVVLWRVEFSDHVAGVIEFAHQQGARVAFDIDDLVFKPDYANAETLDSVRIGTFSENGALALFRRFRDTLDRCDLAVCTTDEIASYLRLTRKPTWVVPNGFDAASERASRRARRTINLAGGDGLVRIGYAAGSRTHQKDFAEAAGAIASVLSARPQTRLVLFYDPNGGQGVVLTDEFAELADCASQIEMRPMVALADLPAELARFDINIAPLERDNPFCAAKSELKYFEAALVDVCTVASASGAIARAIRDGETGFVVADAAEWQAVLLRLVDDPALRRRIGHQAYHAVLWQFGPRRVQELLNGFLQAAHGGPDAAIALEREIRRGPYQARGLPPIVEADILFESDQLREADVTVTIASFNYSSYIIEALESVRLQTLDALDLVVVDDFSPDDSVDAVLAWVRRHAERFNRVTVLRHRQNAGLGASRNSGFSTAETPFVLPLDSDNRLRPECCETLLAVIRTTRAAYVYPQLQHFGASDAIDGGELFEPRRFIAGNYIDAMALIAKWAWAAAGGYYQDRSALGWEDFDLWCSLAELGQHGQNVPQPLTEYRVHPGSMVNAITETTRTKQRVVDTVEQRHPWLNVTARKAFRR